MKIPSIVLTGITYNDSNINKNIDVMILKILFLKSNIPYFQNLQIHF